MPQNSIMETIDFLLDETEDAVVMVNRKNECLRSNPKAVSLLGLAPGSMMDQVLQNGQLDGWSTFIEQVHPGKRVTSRFALENEGHIFPDIEVIGTVFRHSNEVILRFKMEKPKSSNNKKDNRAYHSIFHHEVNCYFVVGTDGLIQDVNERVEYFFGLKPDELIGCSYKELLKVGITENEVGIVQNGIENNGKAEFKYRFVTADEEERFYHVFVYFDSKEELYVALIRDDTEKVILKQQMEHSGSLSAVGQLAASIAHELKNAMTSVRGFTELLKLTTDQDSARYVDVIDSEMGRMESLMAEFLSLSKPSNQEDEVFELSDCLADVVMVMEPQALTRKISIFMDVQLDAEVTVKGKKHRMKQAFINLFKNALEASEPHTTLITSIEPYDQEHVVVAFSDEGSGMTDQQIKQVFLPFFTTKKEGTGLGLPFVLETAESMGGHLFVKSEPGKGTRFELLLPIHGKLAVEQPDQDALLIP
ncbi:PAS domain S-box-containing protein [Bhargavaea ginsengi]|uniref:histidine kinase n=1 Tax=Bhargavaea ginsengi TaxID=426757 RepID=A0A1H6TEL4_9BACL|nr:PAS domain-containing sensor histidine kinase [Bhargavaea ginsengi]SEI75517.1 PAS domain S-box-containing protein [Bhargavaea ginsengi]